MKEWAELTDAEREAFIDKHGGYWSGEHPEYTDGDWRYEVGNKDTRLGYWEWVWNSVEAE